MAEQQHPSSSAMAYDAEAARLDLTSGMHQRSVRHIGVMLIVAFVVIALFNAQGFSKWSEKLPETSIAEYVIVGSFMWQDWMTALGTAELFDALRTSFQSFREMVWQPLPQTQ